MMSAFTWRREPIGWNAYRTAMVIPEEEEVAQEEAERNHPVKVSVRRAAAGDGWEVEIPRSAFSSAQEPRYEAAYRVAADIRKFEIDKYWQRTLYFWGFITAIYVAYYHVLKKLCQAEHGSLPLLVLAALGLFFCLSWVLASKASKHWQENWENHLDLLEDSVTGPLYKTYQAGQSFSVSKINITAGWVLTLCAFGLFACECVMFVDKTLHLKGSAGILMSLILISLSIISLCVYCKEMTGNKKDKGGFSFDRKRYDHEE